ncbi:MAG: hypothetical protein ACPGEG_01890 [Salibacteraceae bacterium]
MKIKLLGLFILGLGFASCGSNQSEVKNEEKKVELAEEVCTFSYNDEVSVKWTAFKFTDKVGVGGTLDSVEVMTKGDFEQASDMLEGLEFNIYTQSVNSSNPDRDTKITSFFFGSMEQGDVINGKVMSVSGNEREGSLSISLTMNSEVVEQQMKYFVEGSSVTINGQLDLLNWKAQGSIDALNNVCKDLHTGEDGKSVLWTDVDIEVVAMLAKNCK